MQLSPQEEARLLIARPVNSEGYDAYLKAKLRADLTGKPGIEINMNHLKTAIRLKPGLCPAIRLDGGAGERGRGSLCG